MKTPTSLAANASVVIGVLTFALGASAAADIDLPDDPDTQVVNLDNEIVVPTDPDAVVFDIDEGALVVLADGRVFRSMAIDDPATVGRFAGSRGPAAAPPPREPSGYEVATLTDDGLQHLLLLADEADLFENDPDYGDGPTDQGYFGIVINALDDHFEHHVYAPSFPTGDPTSQERRDRLFGFVDTLWNIDDEFGNEVSEFENFVPTRWLVTFGGTFVAGPDSWPIAEPPVEGCTKLPSDATADTVSGVYRYDDGVEALTVVVAPIIVDSMCDA